MHITFDHDDCAKLGKNPGLLEQIFFALHGDVVTEAPPERCESVPAVAGPAPEAEPEEITVAMVRAAAQAAVAAGKKDEAAAVLKGLGVKKVPELKEEQYAVALKAFEELT